LNNRIKTKLYKQWSKKAELSLAGIPSVLPDRRPKRATALTSDDTPIEDIPRQMRSGAVNKGVIHLPIRYIVFMLTIIAALLVTLSVLVTIMIT
jgi:hypothetical protein